MLVSKNHKHDSVKYFITRKPVRRIYRLSGFCHNRSSATENTGRHRDRDFGENSCETEICTNKGINFATRTRAPRQKGSGAERGRG